MDTPVKEISFCRQQIDYDPDVKAFRVLVRTPKLIEQKNGIILPSSSAVNAQNFNVGLVLKAGPLAFTGPTGNPYEVKIGTWVWYSKFEREPLDLPTQGFFCYHINDDRILSAVDPEDVEKLLNTNRAGYYE